VKVLSVNVGKPQPNPWKGISGTGIDKCAVIALPAVYRDDALRRTSSRV